MSDDAWQRAPVALLRLDGVGTVVAANRTFLRWTGLAADAVVGRRRLSELMTVGGRIYWETHLSPLLHMQSRVDEVAVELRGPGGPVPVLLTAVVDVDPVTGERFVDVALSGARERSRYERELLAARASAERSGAQVLALQRTTAALSQALGVRAVCDALIGAAVQHVDAASAAVFLTGPDGALVLHRATGTSEGAPVPAPARAALREGRRATVDGTVFVPLAGATRLYGALSVTPRTGASAEPVNPQVMDAIGQQAGLALDRAALYDQSATVAHELQQALLTTHVPDDPRIAVTTAYRPGVEALEVGGDWYDAFVPEEGVLAVAVGDVVGRGLHAATAMGQLRSAVRAIAGPGVGPARLLSRLDRFALQVDVGFMATVVYGEITMATGELRLASAGHLPPLRVRPDGSSELLWGGRSTPLGVEVLARPRRETLVRLGVGDTLVLYTDGLIERRDRPLDDGLEALAQVAPSILRADPAGAAYRLTTEPLLQEGRGQDDVCVLLASWCGPGPGSAADAASRADTAAAGQPSGQAS